ncbi:Ankyrin-3 (ANK-3) (Ankyrin-G), partial [Durusdinium trenchii]
ALPALPASNAPIASEVQTSAASSALSMQTSEKHAPEAADQSDSDVIVEEDQSVVDPKMVDAADAESWSKLGDTVLEELFHRKSRGGETVSGCPWCERRAAAQSPQSPACQASRKPLATRPKEPPSVEEMSLTSPPDEAPSSLEQLRGRCALFRQGHYRHLCSELCYFREFEAARQLRALQDRAMTTGVPWSWLTARLASSHRPPYWCVVFHEASGAVLGSSRSNHLWHLFPHGVWSTETMPQPQMGDGPAGKSSVQLDGPMAALRAAMLLPPLALSTARPSRQRACDFDEVSQDFIESATAGWTADGPLRGRGSLLSDLPGPVILRGVLQDMLPSGKKDYFLQTFANESVLLTRNVEFQSMTGTKPESFLSKIEDWVRSWEQPGSIRYLFSFLHDSEHYHLQQRLLQVYPIPEFLQKHSVSSRFMVLGSKTKGVALHQHFLSWLGLLAGAKRWFVFPPSAQLEDVSHHHQPMAELERRPGVASCVQHEGDVVILPGGWWHATYDRSDWTFGLGAQQYNPNDDERLYAASVGNVSRLKKVKATNALLKQAAEYGHTEAVELLVKKAPMGDTLHTACHKGHLPVVQLLLAHRADVNLQDDLGDRPLNSAVMAGKSDVVEVLVQHRADVNWRRNKKKEPLLHSAARFGHVPVIRALLQSNAVLRQRLKGAGEAIHDAAHFGHRAALRELVAQRADPFASTARGSTTPLQLAMEAGHQPVLQLLQELAVRPEL